MKEFTKGIFTWRTLFLMSHLYNINTLYLVYSMINSKHEEQY